MSSFFGEFKMHKMKMKMITTRNKSIQLSAMFINFRGKPRQNNVNAAVFSFSILFLLFVRNIIIIYMLRATMKPSRKCIHMTSPIH